jgi:hypothetical protein
LPYFKNDLRFHAFFAHILTNLGFAWLVWGLIACSLLTSPSISFCSHLVLTLVLPLGILVGSYTGFGSFDNNSRCFTLLLVVVYWWLVYLLPTLGCRVLSLILVPPWSGHSNYTGYIQGHTVHEFPRHHRRFGVMVTYSTHVILIFFFFSLLAVDLPHLLDELIQGTRRLVVNLQCEVSNHLHKRSPVNWQCGVSGHLRFDVSSAPSLMVHAELFRVVLPTLFHICCWCMLSPHCCQCMPSTHIMFSLTGDTCEWNAPANAFLLTHNPSWLMNFYQIFDHVTEGVNTNRNSNPEDVPVGSPVGVVSDQRKQVVRFWQESIWSQFLHYLASMEKTHTSYISLLELPHCYQSIANQDSLLIVDLGASVCITPH